jgi:hypothetical protein
MDVEAPGSSLDHRPFWQCLSSSSHNLVSLRQSSEVTREGEVSGGSV